MPLFSYDVEVNERVGGKTDLGSSVCRVLYVVQGESAYVRVGIGEVFSRKYFTAVAKRSITLA